MVKRAGVLALYTIGSIRYDALVLPAVAVAFVAGVPWLVVASLVLLALAVAAELFTSVVQGLAQQAEADMVAQVYSDIERYANGSEASTEEADEEGGAGIR